MIVRADLLRDLAVADDLADERVIRRARTRFMATSLVVAWLLAAVAYLVVQEMAERQSRADARARAGSVAAVVGAWVGTVDDPARRGELSRVIRAVAAEQSVDHAVVWRADGMVVWADDPDLVGQKFTMQRDLRALFSGSGPIIGRPEPVDLESAAPPTDVGRLVEVFAPTRGVDGEPLVVESYVVRSSLADYRRATLWLLLPYVVAALALIEGTCLVLCVLMVRQVRRGRVGRIRLTAAAIRSMEKERRELAHELHDGIIQDLAGTRYALGAIAEELSPALGAGPKQKLQRIQEVLGQDLCDLRGLLGDLLVPSARESGSLDQALRALVRHLVPLETRCHIEVDCPTLTPEEGRVVYRIVREGVSNAVRHAAARDIRVLVESGVAAPDRQPELTVLVEDDGHGPSASMGPDAAGHFGLVLLAGLVHEHGGTLTFAARRDVSGARLVATLPLRSLVLA